MIKIRLKKLVNIRTGKLNANSNIENGKYPLFTCSVRPLRINSYSYNCECVLIGGNGEINVKYYNGKFDAYQRTYIIESNNKDLLDIKYLYYFMCRYVEILRKQSIGGVIKYIRLENIKNVIVPLPSIKVQKKIAEILDEIKSVVGFKDNINILLDEYLKSMFKYIFGDPKYDCRKWKFVKFGEIIDVLADYHSNGSYKMLKSKVKLLDEPNYAYMVRTSDLESKDYKKNVKYISKESYEFLKKTKLFGGEIIINKIGSAGKVYMMPYLNMPVSLGMNQFMIRLNSRANNVFIYNQLKSNYGRAIIKSKVQGAVTKTITKNSIRELKIFLPPIEFQNKFAAISSEVEIVKQKNENAKNKFQNLFNCFLQKVFGGDL